MRCLLFSLLSLHSLLGLAQPEYFSLLFQPIFEGRRLEITPPPDSLEHIHIENLKFYLSHIELWKGDQRVYAEPESFHLLDVADSTSMVLPLELPPGIHFTHVQFHLGIDSLTSVSGAYGGDLDPTQGMYWTWQSGFIHFKLEGRAKKCPARKHRFQYHIGGYEYPYKTLQTIRLEVLKKEELRINIDLDTLFDQLSLEEDYQIMQPSQESVEFSRLVRAIFSTTRS